MVKSSLKIFILILGLKMGDQEKSVRSKLMKMDREKLEKSW